jgi:hypothetical protein
MKPIRTTAEQIAHLKYGLQACRNLEAGFFDFNDRQKQIKKESKQTSK